MDSAGPVSRALFLWVQPLLRAGYRRPLQEDQAPPFPKKLRDSLHERFKQLWADELADSKSNGKGPSLHRAFFKLVESDFKFGLSLQLIAVLCKFSCVIIIRRLAQIVSMPGDEGRSEGLVLAGLLFVFNSLDGVLASNATGYLQLALYAVQSCVSHSVLLKGMMLHPDSQAKYKRGDLVTLALSDFSRVIDMSAILMLGLSAPFMLLVAFIVMTVILGPLVLVGIAVALLAGMTIGKIGKFQGGKFRGKMIAMGGRMSNLNEMLQSVRFTKYYGLEEHYQTQILQIRKREENELRGMKYAMASTWPIASTVPIVVVGLILCIYLLINGHLPDQADTFAVLGAAKFLYIPMAFFGNCLGAMNMLYVTIARLQGLLMQPEIERVLLSASANSQQNSAVRIANRSFAWSAASEAPPTLKDIDLVVPKGEFWAVVGELGSGKSSLLMAIMGGIDMVKSDQSGGVEFDVPSRVYVAQEPMIMNASVKDNVLFGLDVEKEEKLEERYGNALAAAALETDLDLLPAGDKTEIGEKGITLSGGQKARVALARAVLASNSGGLVLLDDPLSAVDAHVGKHIFEKCIVEELAGSTRLLVTNQLHFLNHAAVANIVVMEKGCIVEQGNFDTLRDNPESHFSKMLESVGGVHGAEKEAQDGVQNVGETQTKKVDQIAPTPNYGTRKTMTPLTDDKSGKLTEKEKKQEGAVTWKSFAFYIQSLGGIVVMFGLMCCAWLFHITEMAPDMVLVVWQDDLLDQEDSWYLPFWLVTAAVGVPLCFSARYSWVWASVRACSSIHRNMLERVLHCPTSFFDRTPSGRIMNRMGEDQMLADLTVPLNFEVFFIICFTTMDQLTVTIIARPLVAPFVLALGILLCFGKEVHRRTYREVLRWWMVSKSPVFNIFEEILSGTTTIFAFGCEGYFLSRFEKALRSNLEWLMARDSTNLWIDLRMIMIGAMVAGILAVQIVLLPSQASSSFGLIALIYALQLGFTLKTTVFFAVQVEGSFTSIERAAEFCQIEQEPAWHLPTDKELKAQNWPGDKCTLEFVSVCIRYLPHLPRALDEVSATFAPREKVGIVGRTGSGKSTVMGTLLRLFDLEEGKILLGGVDISKIGLKLLRGQITIVPQDPVLFSGPVRKNLDPLSACSDEDIWFCLKKCFLTDLVEKLEGGLDAKVDPGGANFSVGERQVLCLARALLRSSCILCLDEATANVDPVNDQRIQQILQTQMQELLVLTIAHRLHTVMHSDRIMVLDAGKLAQLDTPKALLSTPGIFQDLATTAGFSLIDAEVNSPKIVGA